MEYGDCFSTPDSAEVFAEARFQLGDADALHSHTMVTQAETPKLRSIIANELERFVPMFDGKTLNGWSIREGPDSAFYVHDA